MRICARRGLLFYFLPKMRLEKEFFIDGTKKLFYDENRKWTV